MPKKGLAEWYSSKFTLYRQSFDYSTPYYAFLLVSRAFIQPRLNAKGFK